MANILIVDDSSLIRETLKAILTEAGHAVIAEAGNGYEACMEFDKHQPDLVTMDINMPYMNGLEALDTIMCKHPHAKVIMVSNEVRNSFINQSLHLGAKSYIMKPFDIQGVVTTVNKILQCGNHISTAGLQSIYTKISSL
ncbi:MAG: response regulator [Clostridia bacterium]|nr:response regulator [Clostridia bacterium]